MFAYPTHQLIQQTWSRFNHQINIKKNVSKLIKEIYSSL